MFFFLDACTRMSGLSPGKDPGHATQSGTGMLHGCAYIGTDGVELKRDIQNW